jgi:peptidyl-prolyl cis-trans isomerase D
MIVDFMKKNEKNTKQRSLEVEYVLIEDKASPADETEVKTK